MKNRFFQRFAAVTLVMMLLFAAVSSAYATVGNVYQTAEQGVRLRREPVGGAGHEGNIIRSLPYGSKVVHLSSSGNWWRVRTATGDVGYVFNNNLKAASASASAPDKQTTITGGRTYTVRASQLVVRKSPSTKSKKLGKLRKGSSIKVVAVKNGWAKVTKNGRVGYVSARYLG